MEEAERDLVCESMLGMVQPGKRAGIGFGEWKKPWEKMNFEERRKAALERVQENLQKERVVEYGSLELQSGWARWREDVLSLDLSYLSFAQSILSMDSKNINAFDPSNLTTSRCLTVTLHLN